MKRIISIIVIVLTIMGFTVKLPAQNVSRHFSAYSETLLDSWLPKPGDAYLLEDGSSPFWKDSVPQAVRDSYITLGNKFRGKAWTQIPQKTFAEYKQTGNRRNYETQEEGYRRQLAALAMAEIMEQRKHFITDIRNGLHYYMNTTWWGVPAHYPTDHPEANNQVIDLFNAETANLMAWTVYMLSKPLEAAEPGICNKVRAEIDRRLLTPARTTSYDWKRRTTNWNPWICSNWLACILLCETDRSQQLNAISQILQSMDVFYDSYPDDGGCDEGISYWHHGAASLFECVRMLDIATNSHINYADDAKLKTMAAFAYKYYIGGQRSVNFADTYSSPLLIDIAYPYGKYVGDHTLTAYAAYIAQQIGYDKNPSKQFDSSLSRELLFLRLYNSFSRQQPKEPLLADTWLPDLQVMTSRQAAASTQGLFIAAKGGHNGESHNHNDVGSFIVYKDAEPVVIDIGAATYTSQTFSSRRYELLNTRSAYHNVPLVNGCEQHEGRQYSASAVKYKNSSKSSTLTLNLTQAYTEEAQLSKWTRTIRLNKTGEVVVTENFKLHKYRLPTHIVLVCCGEASSEAPGSIVIDNGTNKSALRFDSSQLSASIERIDYHDTTIANTWQKKPLHRIVLTISNKVQKGKISYSIK